MRILGIDYGERRVGLALTDEEGHMAFPHAVFPTSLSLVSEIKALVKEKGVGEIVIGESMVGSGIQNPIMEKIMRFKSDLAREVEVPVELISEHFSSAEASRFQGKERGRGKASDASAAAIILENYLAKKRHGK